MDTYYNPKDLLKFGEIGEGDIRTRAARDWVAGEWIQENIAN